MPSSQTFSGSSTMAQFETWAEERRHTGHGIEVTGYYLDHDGLTVFYNTERILRAVEQKEASGT